MLIFWKARLVLLSMPKTGTTALEAAFGPHADAAIHNPPGLKHMGPAKWRQSLAPVFERRGKRPLETMALVREPVDWLGSWWRYRAREGLRGQPNSTEGVGFDPFVEGWLSDAPPPHADVGQQSRFLRGGVDHLFRYERFDAALAFLNARLGLEVAPDRLNVSPEAEAALSPALNARLRRERAEEFALWDGAG
ncbi:gamma-glutamyl kinase [Jannaschia sp. W003]|uniref:gamma-glutamyl kinase n=1 Tax=Jannaschia sp. W003 TaxID=2867012 RepID=UPI0021A38503|nr:gamma-glutamyl kinase [Jannaschia sp. W003]UWQ20324.1 gamma-glutamyl kinase [Jannaschia sp. W003]